ncbi:MAG: RluA family pseudouridine synthase [Oceanospirillaceae bacterium]|nr:RluA family pseudouridine synthase [Oceanospirillaceae bacterium]
MPEIIFSDDQLVIVNKPADLLSVPGRGEDKQDCVWRRVQQSFPTARIVHRLDYATSGLMVLALNADSHRRLSTEFQERRTQKSYQAIVYGTLKEETGEVTEPLRCDWDNRPLQIVDYEYGKNAHTRWKKLRDEPNGTRVQLTPITGRSHQLRVHMQFLGHPIIGDRFYASDDAQALSHRLLLHAEQLGFNHPETGDWQDFTAPVPF